MAKDKIEGRERIVGTWGNKPLFRAKVGTGPGTLVMIYRVRKFFVGQRIRYVKLEDTRGMCILSSPPWREGLIYDINENFLFIEKF